MKRQMMPRGEVYLAPEITAAVSLTLSCAHSMIKYVTHTCVQNNQCCAPHSMINMGGCANMSFTHIFVVKTINVCKNDGCAPSSHPN